MKHHSILWGFFRWFVLVPLVGVPMFVLVGVLTLWVLNRFFADDASQIVDDSTFALGVIVWLVVSA